MKLIPLHICGGKIVVCTGRRRLQSCDRPLEARGAIRVGKLEPSTRTTFILVVQKHRKKYIFQIV